jgi:hypothetical protein
MRCTQCFNLAIGVYFIEGSSQPVEALCGEHVVTFLSEGVQIACLKNLEISIPSIDEEHRTQQMRE